MQPPHISESIWWLVSVAVTVVYLITLVPLMPNRGYRIRVSLGPVAGALFAAASGLVKHMGPGELLPLYASVVLGVSLSLVGRRREMRTKVADMAVNGRNRGNELSRATQVQVMAVLLACMAVGLWFTEAAVGRVH
ncbi:hypothetical protein ACIGXM_03390 [Kitasatospora sp. NPDC052896]|uniref:hypothetical protein n=1 Tax=Kitasatospora sp. NPDC052896 TaxID=3364061 RepID=UPI0037C69BFF